MKPLLYVAFAAYVLVVVTEWIYVYGDEIAARQKLWLKVAHGSQFMALAFGRLGMWAELKYGQATHV